MGLRRKSHVCQVLAALCLLITLSGASAATHAATAAQLAGDRDAKAITPPIPDVIGEQASERVDLKEGYEFRVAVGEWPPMISETLPDFGKHAKRFQTIFSAMGFKVQFVFVPWQRAYEQTRRGVYIATFPWLGTDIRIDEFHVPHYPIAHAHQKGFYKTTRFPDGINLNRLADVPLLGLRPVGIASYWYEEEFRRLGIAADMVSNPESAWRFLDADRADILFEEEEVGWFDLTRLLGEKVAATYATTDPITTNNMFILFSRNHPDGEALMRAYERYIASDEGQEICKEWSICKEDLPARSGQVRDRNGE